jgi:hypothetical protein
MYTLLNQKVYGSLLEKYQPKAIASESEYQKSLDAIASLMAKVKIYHQKKVLFWKHWQF